MPLIAGGTTPPGAFIRSERPDRVQQDGWSVLHGRGVRAVLDLQQPVEREAQPSRVPDDIADLHVDHDGLADHPDFRVEYWDTGLVGTPLQYLPHLEALPERTLAVGQGRPSGEPAVQRLLGSLGTDSARAFRSFPPGLDVDVLLDRLPEDEAVAIRTWRGALPGRP